MSSRRVFGEKSFLEGLWYAAALSRDIRRGALKRKMLFGEPVLLGRTKSGEAFVLRDVCPHRGAPLSAGRLLENPGGAVVECAYHGWRFATDGRCASLPALSATQERDLSSIKASSKRIREAHGVVWVLYGNAEGAPPPSLDMPEGARPKAVARLEGEARFDEAVIGLVDPAHSRTVHRKWWWRAGTEPVEKTKSFEPTPLGFRMRAHRPASSGRLYRVLGAGATTEIEFMLPGVRVETMRAGNRFALGLTAITPREEGVVELLHCLYWDYPAADPFRPILQAMTRSFLAQDARILRLQNENLVRLDHAPLFVGDPDEPAKWYLLLKRAWMERDAGEAFVNPLAPAELRWRT